MKKSLLILFVLLTHVGFAQRFSIQGHVTDSLGGAKPLATVMLLNPKDSSLVNFAVSDGRGFFEIKNVQKGNYQLKITFVGFAPFTRNIVTPEDTTIIELGVLQLQPVSKELGEVVVLGERAPVTVKKDTIEFNASSFKTKPNANVEDLLKKLPGVQVETDGTIRAQGEQVQRVMVDGREFFGRDPKLATRNLPADAVDKVQVFDKKSDQAVFSGVDDGQREKAINLALKEEKRNGVFGNLMGGAGTTNRFMAKANINRFGKGKQFSVLGMGNNINEQGFSIDDYMNFTGGVRQMMGGGGGAVRLEFSSDNQNGVPLNFGGRENGIMTNYAGGINLNRDLGTKTQINSSYFYNHLDQNLVRSLHRVNYLPAGNYDFDQQSRQHTVSDNHRANITVDHRLDSANSIRFNANASYTQSQQNLQSQSKTRAVDGSLQNRSDRNTFSRGSSTNVNSTLLFRHRFAKKGRNFSTNLSFGLSQNALNGNLQSTNQFYTGLAEEQNILQMNSQHTDNQMLGSNFSYAEPLGGRKYLEANYSFRTNRNQVDRKVFDEINGAGKLDSLLSNQYNSNYIYNRPGLNFRLNRRKYNFVIGAGYQQTHLTGTLILKNIKIDRTFQNILPVVHLNIDFSNFRHARFDYETSMQEPTIQQLQPVVDNSDPLNLIAGNPELRPGYVHRLSTNFTLFDPAKFISFFAFVTGQYTTNAITTSQTVDQNLVRLSKPVNVRNNLNVSGDFNVGFPVSILHSRFSIGTNIGQVKGINLLNEEENTTRQQTLGGNARYDYTLKEILTIGLSANLTHQQTKYSFNALQNQVFFNKAYSAEMNLNFLKNYSFNTSFEYLIYNSQTTQFSQKIPLLNISFSRFILKNKVGELKVGVNNLLNRSFGVTQTADTNYLQQETANNLGRFYMISFTYSLNKQLNPLAPHGGGGMRVMIRQ